MLPVIPNFVIQDRTHPFTNKTSSTQKKYFPKKRYLNLYP